VQSPIYYGNLHFGVAGMAPISGPAVYDPTLDSTPQLVMRKANLSTVTLTDDAATADHAAISDVRYGTVYANTNRTGTAHIPAAGSVALGVPVDATTGTAVLTAQQVRDALALALSSGIPVDGSIDNFLIKVKAAFYDTIVINGNVLTLSDGSTQTISDTGRVLG
jgi:hypothetical protein